MRGWLTVLLLSFCAVARGQFSFSDPAFLGQQYVAAGGGGGNGLLASLVSAWNMDATGSNPTENDLTANAHNLAVFSGTFTGDTTTKIEGSGSLSTPGGSGSYRNNDAGLKISSAFSILMWFNSNGVNPASAALAYREAVNNNWQLDITAGNKARFQVRNAADDSWGTAATSTVTINSTADWHLIVVTWDGSSTLQISVDGETFAAGSNTGMNANTASPFELFGAGGLVDEMAFWARALSQADVTALWNGGAGLFYPSWTS